MIESGDLRPVGIFRALYLGVERADSGLDLKGTRPLHQEYALHGAGALTDFAAIPARAILLFEQHHLAFRPDTCLAARIMEEH